jgi:hypothetical protein
MMKVRVLLAVGVLFLLGCSCCWAQPVMSKLKITVDVPADAHDVKLGSRLSTRLRTNCGQMQDVYAVGERIPVEMTTELQEGADTKLLELRLVATKDLKGPNALTQTLYVNRELLGRVPKVTVAFKTGVVFDKPGKWIIAVGFYDPIAKHWYGVPLHWTKTITAKGENHVKDK